MQCYEINQAGFSMHPFVCKMMRALHQLNKTHLTGQNTTTREEIESEKVCACVRNENREFISVCVG